MPKLALNGAHPETTIPHGLVVVRAYLQVAGGAGLSPAMSVVRADGSLVPDPPIPPPPGTTVIPADHADAVTVIARSAGGFPAGSALTVVIEVGEYAVHVGPLPVGGLSSQAIAALSVEAERLRVRAVSAEASDDARMGPVGEAVRAAAADVLGTSRVAPIERLDMAVVIDGSASMRAPWAQQAVPSIVDVLAGIAAVVANRPEIFLTVSGPRASAPTAVALSAVSEQTTQRWAAAALSSGARLDQPGLYSGSPETNTVSWIVTDDVPASLRFLAGVNDTPGSAVHLVVLASDGAHAGAVVEGIPVTTVPARDLQEGVPSPAVAHTLVRSLLRDCFAPGTASFGRVQA